MPNETNSVAAKAVRLVPREAAAVERRISELTSRILAGTKTTPPDRAQRLFLRNMATGERVYGHDIRGGK